MTSSWLRFDALNIDQVTSKLKAAFQTLEDSFITKVMLKSPDLLSEKAIIDKEEREKESMRDKLIELLPWETRNEFCKESVEKCRDEILSLSSKEETFTLPYAMPDGSRLPKKYKSLCPKTIEEANIKLSKMELFMPHLLEPFDLDKHVGLIRRIFDVDQKLVNMHSQFIGAGEREKIFWKNYFFHCACIRHKQGLFVDEIWSNTCSLLDSKENIPSVNERSYVSVGLNFNTKQKLSYLMDNGLIVSTNMNTINDRFPATYSNSPDVTSIYHPIICATKFECNRPEVDASLLIDNDKKSFIFHVDSKDDFDDLDAEIARELAG